MLLPKIKISLSIFDWILELISVIGLIGIVILVSYSFNLLPATIPIHYSATGRPDALNGKGSLWVLPIVAIFIFVILSIVPLLPDRTLNYPVRISAQNAVRQRQNMISMVRTIKPLTVLIFLYVTYAVIQNGLGTMDGLSAWFLPIALVSVFGTVGIFVIRAFVLK